MTRSGTATTISRSISASRAMKMLSTMGLSRRTAKPLKADTSSMATQAQPKRPRYGRR